MYLAIPFLIGLYSDYLLAGFLDKTLVLQLDLGNEGWEREFALEFGSPIV